MVLQPAASQLTAQARGEMISGNAKPRQNDPTGSSAHIPEVGLLGRAPDHGLVVGVKMRVVVDLKCRGLKGGYDLWLETRQSR